MKILIVDDDAGTLNALKVGLSSFGHNVVVAEEGHQALKVIETSTEGSEPVDLMVTDLKMPGMNGLELIRSAKKLSPALASILITAFGDDDVRRDVVALKCGYIEKPFTPETLMKMINPLRAQRSTASI